MASAFFSLMGALLKRTAGNYWLDKIILQSFILTIHETLLLWGQLKGHESTDIISVSLVLWSVLLCGMLL